MTLAAWAAAQAAGHGGDSGFLPLESGHDALAARAALARAAQHTLDLQYYIVRGDAAGMLLLAHVFDAAERGVRVRLLFDDWPLPDVDEELAHLDAHPGIEVRLFNPRRARGRFNPLGWWELARHFGRLNRRMHNKLWLADGAAGIVGGRNLGNEYFEAHDGMDFRDLDLLSTGPVVQQMDAVFQRYWDSPFAVPLRRIREVARSAQQAQGLRAHFDEVHRRLADSPFAQALAGSELAAALAQGTVPLPAWGPAQVLADDPAKLLLPPDKAAFTPQERCLLLAGQLSALAPRPERELLLAAPYFVPGRAGLALLRALAGRGVRVRVLTNSLQSNDVLAAQAGWVRWRRAVLRAGVQVHELMAGARRARVRGWRPRVQAARQRLRRLRQGGAPSRASLHEKSFVIDRETVFVGSLNLDPRSIRLNTEVGVLVRSPALAQWVADNFERNADPRRAWALRLAGRHTVWAGGHGAQAQVHRVDPGATPWQRLALRLLVWLAPEGLL
jgi:putative cardiolipin synthase